MKDFAESWEQRDWAMHAAEYVRMHGYIEKVKDRAGYPATSSMRRLEQYARRRIAELESTYPQLKAK